MLYLVCGILFIFKTPSFGVINGALWGFIVIRFWLMVGSRGVMHWGMVNNCMVNWSSMVNWATMVDKGSRVMGRSSMIDRLRAGVIDRGGVIYRLDRSVGWGRGVAIYGGIIGMHGGSGHRC